MGEPLQGHRGSVRAVATAIGADGRPMFISGCEAGEIRRWDAESGARIGEPLTREVADVGGLSVFHFEDGRQLLVCVDHHGGMHQWDPVTGEQIGSRISVPSYAYLFSAYLDHGVPTVFIATDDEDMGGFHIERWRLDTGVRVDVMPPSFRCAFDDSGRRLMALSHEDGSVVLTELPPLSGI